VAVGYEVFQDRPRGNPSDVAEPVLGEDILVGPDESIPDELYDIVIVGSGAAGSVLARRCVEQGLNVAVIEAGDYVPEKFSPGGRRPLPQDELDNLLRYYKDAGLQFTDGAYRMFVFQGQCVGGSSVVNNAVCFRMPDHVRETWAERYGAVWATNGALDAAYDRIAAEIGIGPVTSLVPDGWINPSVRYLASGARALGQEGAFKPCDVNVHDCPGCGYCNLTCAYGRKRTVLQTMLPAAAAAAASGRGGLRILHGWRALRLRVTGTKYRAEGVVVARRSGSGPSRVVRGRKVVVSAGAVGSSVLLGRTDQLFPLELPIGEHFCFNFGSPVHAEYDEVVRAFDGIQIGHYYAPDLQHDGFVIETWFNPPATQSLALPGWMDELQENIRRYAHYACAAPLIGSGAASTIDARHTPEKIWVQLGDDDLEKLKRGLVRTCELFFHSTPAPRRVLLGTSDDWSVDAGTYRDRIEAIDRFDDIQIGTGHPQGGNALGSVVGAEDFRVRDTTGLYVVDASVFPSSLGVNPQWTIMALADLAAAAIMNS
jgi:choline dehydrogenase-like flavoprotein